MRGDLTRVVRQLRRVVGCRCDGGLDDAQLLQRFVEKTPWAHLDIAGTAFGEREHPLGPKGGTGVAVRTLLTYLTALGGQR